MKTESQESVSGNSDTSIRQDQTIENLEFGEVSVGSIGILLKQPLLIASGNHLYGRVVDPLGHPISGLDKLIAPRKNSDGVDSKETKHTLREEQSDLQFQPVYE